MTKINLREISSRAKQWDHPGKCFLKTINLNKNRINNILKFSKEDRELCGLSLFGFGLQEDTGSDWWINIPNQDPPDGLIMNLLDIDGKGMKVMMREIEMVEHRTDPELLFDVIKKKLVDKFYNSDTVLVCFVLSPAVHDLKLLSEKLEKVSSEFCHVFVIFLGVMFNENIPSSQEFKSQFSVVQLLPKFNSVTFDLMKHIQIYKEKYEIGQESRLIDDGEIFYGTVNPKFAKS
ncbi:MAG: hypothetical protein WCV55_02075 [Candidatus Paceibacterota bacterium]